MKILGMLLIALAVSMVFGWQVENWKQEIARFLVFMSLWLLSSHLIDIH